MKSKLFLFLLVGLLAVAMIAGCQPTADDPAVDDEDENGEVEDVVEEEVLEPEDWDGTVHTIAAIYPLTGPLSDYAENNVEAAKLAAADVNEWLEDEGKDWRLRLIVDDTQFNPPVTLMKMQSWYGSGVTFFAGPMGSGEVTELLSFANANDLIVVSPSSTAIALSIPDDALFRFCTDDTIQGPAIAAAIKESGVEHLIFGWRNDVWGDGLQAAVEASLDPSIQIYPQRLFYDPIKEDFTTDVALLDGYVTELVEQGVSLDKIGFNLISFGEAEQYLTDAASYDQLREIKWFGSDGTTKIARIVENEVAGQFAADTLFINPMNRPSEDVENSRLEYVKQHVLDTLGREPESYTYNTYDIIWALALAIDEVGYDALAAREVLPRIADEWTKVNGASGHIILNENGDRNISDYDYSIVNQDIEWEDVGYFQWATQSIIWDVEIY